MKMNRVINLLTIITTIFVPLSFLVGVYGMNFENMPELATKYGYFVLWAVMISISVTSLIIFKRKNWL
jgi:magnesium transporter